jgi:hypothetical protein
VTRSVEHSVAADGHKAWCLYRLSVERRAATASPCNCYRRSIAHLAIEARGLGVGAVLGTWWQENASCLQRLVLVYGIDPEHAAAKIWGRS